MLLDPRAWRRRPRGQSGAESCIKIKPVQAVEVGMEGIVTLFVAHVQEDEQETDHSDGQPADVDTGVEAVFEQVAEGDFQIILYHSKVAGAPGG